MGENLKLRENTPDEAQTTIEAAREIASALTLVWPQFDESGSPRYVISGSLAICLFAGAEKYVDGMGIVSIPSRTSLRLKSVAHVPHDIDIENLKWPWPDVLCFSDYRRFMDLINSIEGVGDMRIDQLDNLSKKVPAVALNDMAEKWMVTRLDYLIALKVLSVFHNFQRKPDQLNLEVPQLVIAGIEMYGENHMWRLIRKVIARFDALHSHRKKYGFYISSSDLFPQIINDGRISDDLIAILETAMVQG